MKITAIVQAVGLASIFSSQGMASPAVTDGKALSLTERTACKPSFYSSPSLARLRRAGRCAFFLAGRLQTDDGPRMSGVIIWR